MIIKLKENGKFIHVLEVINYKTQGEWKIQLTMIINFIFSKDPDEIHTVRTKSNNIEIMMGNKIDESIEEFFESLSQKYQKGLEKIEGK